MHQLVSKQNFDNIMMHGTNVKIMKATFCWFVVYNYVTMHGVNNIKIRK